ncbi:alpha/beta hydrolase [Burkholderia cepacia]|uniref:Alpha/beta hydrolase n=1 Tax=Burkholderia cepacia TaxID=292 RepID=A0A2S8HZ49_BURCE|nr:alpha/beta hydrolase [Burkholderia cepacia]PQP07840.1 alpha/beta hydrolase [Burkholderia cepacia]HDR9511997.1 alpha/beta hydrolase [Burkholderia cepacia]
MDMSIERMTLALPDGLSVEVERHVFHPDGDSVMIVNGLLQTRASVRATIHCLRTRYNVICFDPPCARGSRTDGGRSPVALLSRYDEAQILLQLIERFTPDFLYSASWGGFAALLALARGAPPLRRAMIAAFSPFVNDALTDFLVRVREAILTERDLQAAHLLNSTLGAYLPRPIQRANRLYLSALSRHERLQLASYLGQVLAQSPCAFVSHLDQIHCPVRFVNGELDAYTTVEDGRAVSRFIARAQSATVPGAGHFLDLEGAAPAAALRDLMFDFFGDARAVSEGGGAEHAGRRTEYGRDDGSELIERTGR